MPFVIGVLLAIVVGVFATSIGLDRDRAFYPTVMIVIASYYALFATMAGGERALIIESAIAAVFLGASVLGFKSSLWLVVAALAGHGAFDLVHPHLISNLGVPEWWPSFCLAFDVAAAAYLAWLLMRERIPVRRAR